MTTRPTDVNEKSIQTLRALYGKNKPSSKKIQATEMFMKGDNSFLVIARVLNVATATAEVCAIDGYCSGAPLSYQDLAPQFNLNNEEADIIAAELRRDNVSLRIVRDALQNAFSYNQIRLVLAALIRGEI
ncbi:Hypothetical predicted protein [Paramuricea clavata]|uniref:Uncharacterized protein n=1 Tax=Paramuricea clavata TaxID=317549 RepID=A0A7D9DVA7_PARCT|nr:Hypothetical predicted protein [Paramuricea clavata]